MKSKNQEIIDVFNSRYACKKFDKNRRVSDEDFILLKISANPMYQKAKGSSR